MKKLSSKSGSQLILKDDGGYTFKMSKNEWRRIGKQAGWWNKQTQPQTQQQPQQPQQPQQEMEEVVD